MAPHLPSSTQAWLAWADTLDTRITCSVEWVWYCVERDPRGGDPSGVPSQTAKNAEQRTIARGDGDITHSLLTHSKGGRNDEAPPQRAPHPVWPLTLACQWRRCLSLCSLCLLCPGCRAFPHLGLNPALRPRTRNGTITRAFTESVVVCGDPSLTANAVCPPPSPDLPPHAHTRIQTKHTLHYRSPLHPSLPAPLPALAL